VSSAEFVEGVARGMVEAYIDCTPEQQARLRAEASEQLTPRLLECWARACELLGFTEQTGQKDAELSPPGLRNRKRFPLEHQRSISIQRERGSGRECLAWRVLRSVEHIRTTRADTEHYIGSRDVHEHRERGVQADDGYQDGRHHGRRRGNG
jgi:hypothetical protein